MSEALRFLSPGSITARSPLATPAEAAGAAIEVVDGWEVPVGFGDLELERRAIADSVGFADRSSLAKVEVSGEHGLELGMVDARDGGVWCPMTPTRALVLGDADVGGLDVTAAYAALTIAGPLARETFARFCALDLRDAKTPVGAFRPGSVARTPGMVWRETEDRWLVLFGAAYAEYMWTVVADAAGRLGGRPVGVEALEDA